MVVLRWMAVVLLVLAPVVGQMREFWVVDQAARALALRAPGRPTTSIVELPEWPRQVRADLQGHAVVTSAIRPVLLLVDPTGNLRAVSFDQSVLDAVPDGLGGAWATTRSGGTSTLWRVGNLTEPEPMLELAGVAIRVRHVGGAALALVVADLTGSSPRCVLVSAETGLILDEMFLPAVPTDLVLDNRGRIVFPGLGGRQLPVFSVADGYFWLAEVMILPTPCIAAFPFGGDDRLLLVDRSTLDLRIQPPGSTPFPTFNVGEASTLEALPDGSVLAHSPEAAMGYAIRPDQGVVWQGEWPTSWAPADGAGMGWARSHPREDPDGDTFTNGEEALAGTDSGDPFSAPLALFRAGQTVRLRTPHPSVLLYLVLASDRIVPESDPALLAPSPLLARSLVPGVVFDGPFGFIQGGEVTVGTLAVLPPSVFVGATLFDPITFDVVVTAAARSWSSL